MTYKVSAGEGATIQERMDGADWGAITASINEIGYAEIEGLVPNSLCDDLTRENSYFRWEIEDSGLRASEALPGTVWRKTELRDGKWGRNATALYYDSPLPHPVLDIQQGLYKHMKPLAREFSKAIELPYEYPDSYQEFVDMGTQNGKTWPGSVFIHYWDEAENELHQDVYFDSNKQQAQSVFFPFQAVLMLSQHGQDYEGGAFMLAEQYRNKHFSEPQKYTPDKGSLGIFVSSSLPHGQSGNRKLRRIFHGMDEMQMGERNAIGILVGNASDKNRQRPKPLQLEGRGLII